MKTNPSINNAPINQLATQNPQVYQASDINISNNENKSLSYQFFIDTYPRTCPDTKNEGLIQPRLVLVHVQRDKLCPIYHLMAYI